MKVHWRQCVTILVIQMSNQLKTYSDLILIPTFEERLEYLMTGSNVGDQTFGGRRYLNQEFYNSFEWKRLRRDIIIRDNGCDLAFPNFEIHGAIYIHHMNPISDRDILNRTEYLLNPEFLVCVSFNTHNLIHYGNESIKQISFERNPLDTCPWKNK